MEQLTDVLDRYKRIAIDTSPFIYYIEEDQRYLKHVNILFDFVAEGKVIAITSIISLIEVLTQPLRVGNADVEKKYRDFLLHSRNLMLLEVNMEVAEETARLRAKYKLRTPDAVQLATSFVGKADAFITNDGNLKCVRDIPILLLKDIC